MSPARADLSAEMIIAKMECPDRRLKSTGLKTIWWPHLNNWASLFFGSKAATTSFVTRWPKHGGAHTLGRDDRPRLAAQDPARYSTQRRRTREGAVRAIRSQMHHGPTSQKRRSPPATGPAMPAGPALFTPVPGGASKHRYSLLVLDFPSRSGVY